MTDDLSDFLAAPDNLLKDQRELAKAKQRKAQEAAAEARLAAAKSPNPPTIEDLLADIIRVADDPDTNPFWRFRSISAGRYKLYGHWPISALYRQFGQFEHALQVAGLRDQPGTRLWKAHRAHESRREHASRYFERYVRPYVARREDLRMASGSYRLLSISDTHSMFMCPFTWLAFLATVRELKPDGVLFNGDMIDAVQLSRHPKVPGWTPSLQLELDFQWAMFREVRRVHEGDLFLTGGNHDLTSRLAGYLTQTAKDLAGLRCLRVDELMGLDEHRVQLFQGGSIVSPSGQEDAHTGFLMFDFYRIHHGEKLGANPAADELKAAGRSGQSGHVHRSQLCFGTTEATEGMSWMCTPMGARHEVGRHYKHGTSTGWQRGFGYAELFADGTVHQYPCVVQGERVTCEGFTFCRPGWLKDPDPGTLWLDDPMYQLGEA